LIWSPIFLSLFNLIPSFVKVQFGTHII